MLPALLRVFLCFWPPAQPRRKSTSLDESVTATLQQIGAQSGEDFPRCRLQSRERDHHSLYESRLIQSLTVSMDSLGYSRSSEIRRREARVHVDCQQRSSRKISVENSPQLECVIVPSFGIDPPENVAVKKSAGDFLQGVGDDLNNIQRLMREDDNKELVNVQLMCHFERVKVATFLHRIEEIMQHLRLNEDNEKGCKFMYTLVHVHVHVQCMYMYSIYSLPLTSIIIPFTL